MADYQPDLVDDALRELDSSHAELRDVHARWQRMLHSRSFPAGIRRYEAVLGPPAVRSEQWFGDATCKVASWPPFHLWPGLRFEVMVGPDGLAMHEWLVGTSDSPTPTLRSVDELVPWSCVVGDVDAGFAPVVHQPGETPSRWHTTFTTPDGTTQVAHFVWGLLQAVRTTAKSPASVD